MLPLLGEREFPAAEIVPFASERSVGTRARRGAASSRPDDESIQGFDLALFSAGGSTSGEWAPRFAAAGATVIDNSSRWRMEDDVPLVVAEVNPDALASHEGIIANPNCSTMQMVVALKPLHDAAGIERLVISTYQAVSGTGRARSTSCSTSPTRCCTSRTIAAPRPTPTRSRSTRCRTPAASPPGDDHTDEERKLINETRKILGDAEIAVSATCVRVPVVNGHSEAVNVQTRGRCRPSEARELLARRPGVTVLDDPAAGVYPLAIHARRPRRGVRRADPPRPRQRRGDRPVDRRGQPAQGRRHQRRPDRRAAPRARAHQRPRPPAPRRALVRQAALDARRQSRASAAIARKESRRDARNGRR